MKDFHRVSRLLRPVMTALTCGVLVCGTANAGSVAYQYDALGRLTKLTYSNGVNITYTYDAAGNRTTEVITGSQTSPETIAALMAIIVELLLDD